MFTFYWGFWFTTYFRMPWMRQCGIKNLFRNGDVAAVTARLDDAGVCLSWVYQPVTSTACTIAVWNHIKWMCLPSCLNFTHAFTHLLARSLARSVTADIYQVSATWVTLASYLHPVVHVTAVLNKNFYCGDSSGGVSDMKDHSFMRRPKL